MEAILVGAGVISFVFAVFIFQQFLRRKRPQQLAWTIALVMFSLASLAASKGVADGWTPMLFRTYYLFGAIINVPVLALGTIYLMTPRRLGHALSALVAVASVYATGAVFSAALVEEELAVNGVIPSGRDVMPEAVRILSRYFSITGALVVFAGALWSAWQLSRNPDEKFRGLAQGNILIAVGTLIVSVASAFARVKGGLVLSVGLFAGVLVMFVGFLRTRSGRSTAAESLVLDDAGNAPDFSGD